MNITASCGVKGSRRARPLRCRLGVPREPPRAGRLVGSRTPGGATTHMARGEPLAYRSPRAPSRGVAEVAEARQDHVTDEGTATVWADAPPSHTAGDGRGDARRARGGRACTRRRSRTNPRSSGRLEQIHKIIIKRVVRGPRTTERVAPNRDRPEPKSETPAR